ncbi:MAG: sigma-70 family RNA polymerase sigma factor [Acidobacteria bacterium]|nr:sigma-70 family RNA polymerase sigma factor [Acidobacteriota bacterium]
MTDDRTLIDAARGGDAKAFQALIEKYQSAVFNLIYHFLGSDRELEDVAQEAFLKTYLSLKRFREGKPFLPWLYRIVVNTCYDELRRRKRRKTYTFSDLSEEESQRIERQLANVSSGTSWAQDETMRRVLAESLQELVPAYRAAITLRDLEDLSYEEIAAALNCSVQAARLKVFRGRMQLRKALATALKKYGIRYP